MSYKHTTILFFLSVLSILYTYVTFILSSFGEWTFNTGPYNAYNMKLKFYRAEKIEEKKLIINSGSNSNFGFNSEMLENEIGMPVSNLANHAANRLDYLTYGIKRVVKKGDVVVLPLEFGYYGSNTDYTDYHITTYMRAGKEYFDSLSLIDKAIFIKNIPMDFLLKSTKGVRLETKFEIETLIDHASGEWKGYSHRSLNKTFDMTPGTEVYQSVLDKFSDKAYNIPEISNHFLVESTKLREYLNSIDARLYFTFPTTIKNDNSNFDEREQLKEKMKNLGFKFICEKNAFAYPISYFFNTYYHLNIQGVKQRTLDMASCLKKEGIL